MTELDIAIATAIDEALFNGVELIPASELPPELDPADDGRRTLYLDEPFAEYEPGRAA